MYWEMFLFVSGILLGVALKHIHTQHTLQEALMDGVKVVIFARREEARKAVASLADAAWKFGEAGIPVDPNSLAEQLIVRVDGLDQVGGRSEEEERR